MKKIIMFLWELPLVLVGYLMLFYYDSRVDLSFNHKGVSFYNVRGLRGGVSFGLKVFLSQFANTLSVLHEYGHSRLSKFLGWLYLPLIGLPSVLHLLVRRLFGRRWDYYKFPVEAWADKLGGVERG